MRTQEKQRCIYTFVRARTQEKFKQYLICLIVLSLSLCVYTMSFNVQLKGCLKKFQNWHPWSHSKPGPWINFVWLHRKRLSSTCWLVVVKGIVCRFGQNTKIWHSVVVTRPCRNIYLQSNSGNLEMTQKKQEDAWNLNGNIKPLKQSNKEMEAKDVRRLGLLVHYSNMIIVQCWG